MSASIYDARLLPVIHQVLQAILDAIASDAEILRHRQLSANLVNTKPTFCLGDHMPVVNLLHLTIHVIHVKRCAGSIASRVHATKMILKSCFDLFCCLVWLGLCRMLTKPSNDIINVGGGTIHAHVAHNSQRLVGSSSFFDASSAQMKAAIPTTVTCDV